MVKNYLIYDGQKSSDFGLYISAGATYDAPAQRIEMVQVPGRNGDVAIADGSYENVEITYEDAFVYAQTQDELYTKLRNARSWLLSKRGYVRLWDTYNPDEYRLGIFRSELETNLSGHVHGAQFDLKFDCKPQRFLVSGEETIDMTATGAIENPTRFEALPDLQVIGRGQLEVEGNVITVTPEQTGSVFIDSEQMEAYQVIDGEVVSVNSSVSFSTGKFPTLVPGLNHITLGAGITMVKIVPHWWVI